MTKEQIIQACTKYDNILIEAGAVPARETDVPGSLNHLRWMCQEIINFVNEEKLEKAFRWLGFIQGALWSECICDIEQLKNDNR